MRRDAVRRWAIWSVPARLLLPVLTVEVTALALVLVQIPIAGFDRQDVALTITLLVLGVLHTEIAVRVESVRRRVHETPHVDLCSVWTFAAAVVLPAAVAATVAVVICTHLWWRSYRPRTPPYRHAFSMATIALACLAASTIVTSLGSRDQLFALVLALLAYTTVNSCLIAGAIAVSSTKPDLATAFGDAESNFLEIATLSLGGLTALAIGVNPWLVVFALPPVLVLHRAVLVHYLKVAASTDGKTGLLNAAAWHNEAERALRRATETDGPRGVLVLDLDHFKRVNDTYGHIAGDQVLQAVANALRNEVRDRDLVGRFGGEEFVVLLAALPGAGAAEVGSVAERMRRRVADLRVEIPTPDGPMTVAGLTVSIGGAVHSRQGEDLRSLLHIADTALYSAKRAGRNRVRMGLSVPPSPVAVQQIATDSPSGGE